ncbi:MAG TPA: hypothetical protein PK095_10565, partial [Myxococcota bacterium]|nr:hypothetical protein [Myxococcota bacterium]
DTGPTAGPDGEPPPLSEAGQALRDEAQAALGRKVNGQKKGKRATRRVGALDLIRRLGQAEPGLRREVVTNLDADGSLSELFRFADPKAIWADEVAAQSVLAIFAVRDLAACREDIRELTHIQIHLFKKGGPEVDLGTTRWEARIAWELLMLLPDAEREQLLTGGNTAATADKLAEAKKELKEAKKDGSKEEKKEARQEKREAKAEHREQKKINGGLKLAENNLSLEYKQSSRYDTYEGDAEKTLPEKVEEVEKTTKPSDEVKPVGDTPAEKTTEDTDRQALLAMAMTSELWTDAPEARFRSVIRMVIQADEARVLAPLAKQHWATRGPVLLPLGFAEDGTWKEHIEDKTATRAFGRAIAATVAIAQTIHVVLGLAGKVRFRGEVDLGALCKGFPGTIGLSLEPSKRPADLETLLHYVLGGQGAASALLGLCNLTDAGAFIKQLIEAEHAGLWLMSRLESQGAIVEGADEVRDALTKATTDGGGKKDKKTRGKRKEERETNKLLVETNGLTGEKRIAVPALEIAAISRRSGTSLLKTGASSLYGIELVFKERTALDQKRGVSVKVGAVTIGQLLKTDPQGMVAVDQILLGGMSIELESPETNPSTWLEKLRDIVIHIASRIIEMMPLNWGTLAPKLMKFGSVAAKAYM